MAGQVYAVASGKGGVGKTTTVVNLGVVLRQSDHTVALVDADLGMANLGTLLDVDGETTLHDVLAGEATVEEAVVEVAQGFGVLTGSRELTSYADADPRGLGDVFDALAETYDFVLVDTGAGMSHEDVLPLGLADRVILVTTPERASIGDTAKTAELAELAEGDLAGLVVTMADESTDVTYIGSEIGTDVIGVIPFDASVRESTATAKPLEGLDPESPAAAAYRELAGRLVDETFEPTTRAPAPEADAAADEADPAGGDDEGPDDEAADDAGGPATDEAPPDADAPPEEADAGDPESEAGLADEGASEATADGDAEAADEGPATAGEPEDGDEAAPEADDEDEDYLEEFEDDEPASSGGFLAKLGRLFR